MKANRKYVNDDEAVSPVIAVILMVAITVVLAATVFVLVSDIGGQGAQAGPQIGWRADEAGDRLTVTQAPSQVFWKDFSIRATWSDTTTWPDLKMLIIADQGPYTLNQLEPNAATDLGTADAPTGGCGARLDVDACNPAVSAGDQLEFCANNGAGTNALGNVQITITYKPTNSVSHQLTFSTISLCS